MKRTVNQLLQTADDQLSFQKQWIAEKLGSKPLFGAVGGSISLNLGSKGSDIDFYLVTESQIENGPSKTLNINNTEIDFTCVTLDEILTECDTFSGKSLRYPTKFYRDPLEEAEMVQSEEQDRPGFQKEMVMRIFLADEILEFEKGSIEMIRGEVKNVLKLIDIWDYHFTRAYGNYFENIKSRKKVLLRKYLYTVSQVSICCMALKNDITMNFEEMLKIKDYIFEGNEIIQICRKLWEENRKVSVPKWEYYVKEEPLLNAWIEGMLKKTEEDMRKNEQWLRENFYEYSAEKVVGC